VPSRWISPLLKFRPFQKLSNGGEQIRDLLFTVTPPNESMKAGKFAKSTSTRWFTCRPFPRNDSTVSIVSAGPPIA
jgi:hypothetical protein